MYKNNSPESTGNKFYPSFIERVLIRNCNEFRYYLWEHYEIVRTIRNHFRKRLKLVNDSDERVIKDSIEYLITNKALIIQLRSRFFYLFDFASNDEKESVAKTLNIKIDELKGLGSDYENIIASAIG